MTQQNQLRDVFAETCHRAHYPVRIEMGSGLTPDYNHSHPADVLVEGWERGKPVAFDITDFSTLPSLSGGGSGGWGSSSAWLQNLQAHSKWQKVPRAGLGLCSHCHRDIWKLVSRGKGEIFTFGILPSYLLLTTQVQSYCRPLNR